MLGTSMNDANSYAPTAGEVWVFTQPEYKAMVWTPPLLTGIYVPN